MKKNDWEQIYNDPSKTGDTLREARLNDLTFYQRDCPRHGPTPYAVLDQSCRQCARDKSAERKVQNRGFNRIRELFHERKRRALEKGIPFEITLESIRSKLPQICPALGLSLSFDSLRDTSPSIDKFDNNKGYTEENVRVISTRANRIKSDGTAEEHFKIGVWQLREQGMSDEDIINYFIGRV